MRMFCGTTLVLALVACPVLCSAGEEAAGTRVSVPPVVVRSGLAPLMTTQEVAQISNTLTLLEEHRRDWEVQVNVCLDEYLGERKSQVDKSTAALRAGNAIEIARLLVMRRAIPRLKKIVVMGAENSSLLRPAMRALSRLDVGDDYWLKSLSTKSKNGRDYVACAALCEVWDSPSPKIKAAIKRLREDIAARKGVNYGKGLPTVLHTVSSLEATGKEYAASRLPYKLRLIEKALANGKVNLGRSWVRESFGRSLNDYDYLHVRWGAKRLLELSREHPEAIAKHIASLPFADSKDLKVQKEARPVYREYLLQWLGADIRKRVKTLQKGKS